MKSWTKIGSPPLADLGPADRCYAIVDGAQVDRLGLRIANNQQVVTDTALFGSSLAPATKDATPHLLLLKQLQSVGQLMQLWERSMLSHGAISVVISPLDAQVLSQRLSARLDARLPDSFDCVNRYFDGRITPHLHACLSDSQRIEFFSVASQWWVVGHNYQWQSLSCAFAGQDCFESPLKLDDAQQAAMVDACYPYSVIDHFLKTDEELLDTVAPSQRYSFFSQALRDAAAWGIDGGAAAVLFCTLAMTRGPGFHSQADWQADLERVKRGDINLQQAVRNHHD